MGEREHGGMLRTVVVLSLISAIAAIVIGAAITMANTNKSRQDGIVSKLTDVADNNAADDSAISNYGYDYDERNLTATISRVTNRSAVQGKDIQIPAKVKHNGKTYTVTAIGSDSFNNVGITGVTIPSSVTTIGDGAFICNKISSLTLPNSLKSIESCAFSNNQISSLVLPDSLENVGDVAFANNKLTKGSVKGGRNLESFDTGKASSSFGTYRDGADVKVIKPTEAKASAEVRSIDDGDDAGGSRMVI